MLSFEEKLAILESFPELERRDVSLGRVNFHYEQSVLEKKNVGFHFHPNGNGYIFAGELDGYQVDDKGFVNIRDYSEEELRSLVEQAIRSLTGQAPWKDGQEEQWVDSEKASLVLKYEDDMWYIFSGLNLEAAFETYQEAREYLREEGFMRQ
jgi:exonuclease VII small subunit